MAKKDKKKHSSSQEKSPAESVRAAVEQAVATTTGEITSAAVRVRDAIEDLRVLDDIRGLRGEIDRLERRVAELEGASAKPAPRKKAPARKRAAASKRAPAAKKAPARKKPPATKRAPARAAAGTKPAGTRAASPKRPPRKAPPAKPAVPAAPGRS